LKRPDERAAAAQRAADAPTPTQQLVLGFTEALPRICITDTSEDRTPTVTRRWNGEDELYRRWTPFVISFAPIANCWRAFLCVPVRQINTNAQSRLCGRPMLNGHAGAKFGLMTLRRAQQKTFPGNNFVFDAHGFKPKMNGSLMLSSEIHLGCYADEAELYNRTRWIRAPSVWLIRSCFCLSRKVLLRTVV
jgi:hypothetical protein